MTDVHEEVCRRASRIEQMSYISRGPHPAPVSYLNPAARYCDHARPLLKAKGGPACYWSSVRMQTYCCTELHLS